MSANENEIPELLKWLSKAIFIAIHLFNYNFQSGIFATEHLS